MAFQTVFQRYEIKYMLTQEQKQQVLQAMKPYMELDGYGRTTIRNIYFDTDDYELIRTSIEKPIYKEKLRLRSYNTPNMDDEVFFEIKKKYNSVVNKRRITLSLKDYYSYLNDHGELPDIITCRRFSLNDAAHLSNQFFHLQ